MGLKWKNKRYNSYKDSCICIETPWESPQYSGLKFVGMFWWSECNLPGKTSRYVAAYSLLLGFCFSVPPRFRHEHDFTSWSEHNVQIIGRSRITKHLYLDSPGSTDHRLLTRLNRFHRHPHYADMTPFRLLDPKLGFDHSTKKCTLWISGNPACMVKKSPKFSRRSESTTTQPCFGCS